MKFLENFDKHRDDLSKYCYDMSKIFVVTLVLNPFFENKPNVTDIVLGVIATIVFIIFGILFKK